MILDNQLPLTASEYPLFLPPNSQSPVADLEGSVGAVPPLPLKFATLLLRKWVPKWAVPPPYECPPSQFNPRSTTEHSFFLQPNILTMLPLIIVTAMLGDKHH